MVSCRSGLSGSWRANGGHREHSLGGFWPGGGRPEVHLDGEMKGEDSVELQKSDEANSDQWQQWE